MQIADCLSRNSQRDSEWREDDEEMPAGIIKSEDLFVTKSSAEMLVVQLEKGLYELALPTILEGEPGGEMLAALQQVAKTTTMAATTATRSQLDAMIFPAACGLSQLLRSECYKHSRSVTSAAA